MDRLDELGREPLAHASHENRDRTLYRRFAACFKVVDADTPELIRQAQRVRYQVYCLEKGFENAAHNTGLESDEFDSHAVQSVIVAKATGAALGTVRLILPVAHASERSFAVQRLLTPEAAAILSSLPVRSMAEASRFSISRHLRRQTQGEADVEAKESGPMLSLGLFQALVRMSLQNGITHWCAMMEPALIRMFAAMAIRFRPFGPPVQFRGLRQPCTIDVHAMLDAVRRERPAFGQIITDGGSLGAGALAA